MQFNHSLPRPIVCLGLLLLFPCSSGPLLAAEEWVDGNLKVTDGLTLWLDASRLNAARQALGGTALQPGDRLEVWLDGSGRKHHVSQTEEAQRPKYQPTDDFHAIRFDGKTSLRWSGDEPPARDLTVFLVTAPYSSPEWFSAFFATSSRNRNDFQAGLNIDQAAGSPQKFSVLNVEGSGAQGRRTCSARRVPTGASCESSWSPRPARKGSPWW